MNRKEESQTEFQHDIGAQQFHTEHSPRGNNENQQYWHEKEIRVDPNDVIDSIVDAIDYAEVAGDTQGLNKARRLLNNDLRQAIDAYVRAEIQRSAQPHSTQPRASRHAW